MKIQIGKSTFALESEDLAPLPGGRPGLRMFSIIPESLDGPELIRIVFKTGVDENLYRIFWATLRFGFSFPMETWPRRFDPLSLVNKWTGPTFLEQFRSESTETFIPAVEKHMVRDSLMRLTVWAEDPLGMKGDRLVYWRALYREAPLSGLTDLDWGPNAEIWEYFQELVLEQFPPKFLEAQRAKEYRRKKMIEEVRPVDWRESVHFQAARLLCERMVLEFEDGVSRLVYRQIRGGLSQRERRLFILTQTRRPFLGGFIARQEPLESQLGGFLKMSSDLTGKPRFGDLCILALVLKELRFRSRRVLAWHDLGDYLTDRFARFLSALPSYHAFIEAVNAQRKAWHIGENPDEAILFGSLAQVGENGKTLESDPGLPDPALDPNIIAWQASRGDRPVADPETIQGLLSAHLTQKQAEAIVDHFWRGMDLRKVGKKHGISHIAARKRIEAGKKKLRVPLAEMLKKDREKIVLPRWGYARGRSIVEKRDPSGGSGPDG